MSTDRRRKAGPDLAARAACALIDDRGERWRDVELESLYPYEGARLLVTRSVVDACVEVTPRR